FGDDPVLDADRLASQPIGPPRYVAGGPIPGMLVSRYGSTVMPRSTAIPAPSARAVSGRTPIPTTRHRVYHHARCVDGAPRFCRRQARLDCHDDPAAEGRQEPSAWGGLRGDARRD